MTYLKISNINKFQIKLNKNNTPYDGVEYRAELWHNGDLVNKSNWVWESGEAMMNFRAFEELAENGFYDSLVE